MKILNFTCTLIFTLLLGWSNIANGQVELTVNNPQWWGNEYPGSIDEASLVVKPKGIYMEVSMYLTFSAQETPFAPNDTLEVVLDFNLPEDAIVHDSWLWIEEEIIKADIIDRWTASEIYEEIVDRQQDPSILFKESADKYQLRIFPMAANESRKVKISYLAPTKWRGNEVLIDLPYEILAASNVPLDEVEIITYLDSEWQEPQIKELENNPFLPGSDPDLGTFWRMNVPFSSIQAGMTYSVKSPMADGVFTSQYAPSNIYQLTFSPADIFDLGEAAGANIAFVVSYHAENTSNLSREALLYQLYQTMLEEMSEGDYFNIFMNDSGGSVGEEWLSFSIENVDAVFDELIEDGGTTYNNLPNVLIDAVEFIDAQGGEGEIIALTNSDAEGDVFQANYLIDLLLAEMGEQTIPIHIVDFQNTDFAYYWWDWNEVWYGNEYFYNNLSRLTLGNYDRVGSIRERVRKAIQQGKALYGTLDLYTTLEEGFCYQRYNLGPGNDLIDLSQPILQVGKYEGSFPLKIIANGIYEGNSFSTEIVVPLTDTHLADTLAEEMWAGRYLYSLESSAQSNQNIAEIIDRSISDRVLSLYTAFLCLEPSLGGEPCVGCIDESDPDIELVSNHEVPGQLLTIKAYPNPFVQQVQLQLDLEGGIRLGNYQLGIYNAFGQLVKAFDLQKLDGTNGTLVLEWNPQAEGLATGVYFLVLEDGNNRQTIKLIYLK